MTSSLSPWNMADQADFCEDENCYFQDLFGINGGDFLVGSYRKERDILERSVKTLEEMLLKKHPESSEAIRIACEQLSVSMEVNHQMSYGEWFEWCNRYIFTVPRCIPVLGMKLKAGEVGNTKAALSELDDLDSQIASACSLSQSLECQMKDTDSMILQCNDTLKMLATVKAKQSIFREAADYHARNSCETSEDMT